MPSQLPTEILEAIKKHRIKANAFLGKASKYIVSDPTMSQVCSFYAVYHAMRIAILSDPIFDLPDGEIDKLTGVRGLCKDAKYNTHHSAHRDSPRGLGQNQVIAALYPKRFKDYDDLHKVSIQARYVQEYKGEILPDTRDSYDAACEIVNDALSGKMRWAMK